MSCNPPSSEPKPEPGDHPVAQEINWGDFRDHLATADKDGKRRWIYAKQPAGRYTQARTYVSYLLLVIMFGGPFVRINGNPLLMINIPDRRFSILGQMFWPQDMVILAVGFLIFLTSIIVFTTAFGRLWCGWTCPQTVMMEMVFRKIEYAIEGDALEQRALSEGPWNARKVWKKGLKHLIFLVLSFVVGNTLLSYIIGSEQLFYIVTDDPKNHLTGLTFMVLFSTLFYAIFARFREQACTFICPYGRFQSAILDENTVVVAYDHKRGEKREPLKRGDSHDTRVARGAGDCVSCRQCVAVCPTGIDIRNGTQMECVNCTACIDACDTVMDKVGQPRGLIRYASLNEIEKGEKFKITPRMITYGVVLSLLITLFFVLLFTRSNVEAIFLRAPGGMFQMTAEGHIENLYTMKLVNKTGRDLRVQLKLEDLPGRLTVMGGQELIVPAQQLIQSVILIDIDPKQLKTPNTKFKVEVRSEGKKLQTVKTMFIGPRDGSIGH